MNPNESIAPCRLVTHQDGRTSLLLVIDFKDRHDHFDTLFKEFHRYNNGHGWNQVIQAVIPADVRSTLLFDPEADVVSIVGRDISILIGIAQQIRHLLNDESALRQAIAASELD
jgi:hypothetical protein